MKTNWKKFKLFKILKQLLKTRIIFIKAQKKTVKYQKTPKTEVTMTKKAKVPIFSTYSSPWPCRFAAGKNKNTNSSTPTSTHEKYEIARNIKKWALFKPCWFCACGCERRVRGRRDRRFRLWRTGRRGSSRGAESPQSPSGDEAWAGARSAWKKQTLEETTSNAQTHEKFSLKA